MDAKETKQEDEKLKALFDFLQRERPLKFRASTRTVEEFHFHPPVKGALELFRKSEWEVDDSLPFGEYEKVI